MITKKSLGVVERRRDSSIFKEMYGKAATLKVDEIITN